MRFTEWVLSEIDGHIEKVIGRVIRRELRRAHLATEQDVQRMALNLTALTTAVEAEDSLEASVVTLLDMLGQAYRDAAGDQAAVDAITAQLTADPSGLVASLVANTPAAPAPPTTDEG